MNIYVFGNIDVINDNSPYKYLAKLREDFTDINFVDIKPNQDIDHISEETFYILDTVEGLPECKIFDEKAIEHIKNIKSASVHDYDLGFQLKYLSKLGKISRIKILGLPQEKMPDYNTFQSIFKKFVAQDIQGS